MTLADRYDVAVIGAGPAGLVAATELAILGIPVVVIDEQAAPGGQIYRAITSTPLADESRRDILGDDYWHGAHLVSAFRCSGAHYAPRAMVWAVTRQHDGFELALSTAGAARLVRARHVILATGAMERPFPIPGWTLPGVMTAGAAQILLKTSGLAPSGTTVLAGSGPLLYLIAAQFAAAGVRIACLLDTTPRGRLSHALPFAWEFAGSPYFAKGRALLSGAKRSTVIHRHVDRLEAEGDGKLERVRYCVDGGGGSRGGVGGGASGAWEEIVADHLLLHQGVVPGINLSNAIGCAQHWDAGQLCFTPTVDAWGASSVGGVSIAGDAAGIGGARAAEAGGALSALHAAFAIGAMSKERRDTLAERPRAGLARWMQGRRFVDAMYRPADGFRIPHGDTIVCRCEEVTAAQVAETVKLGCVGPNQMKSFLRCGMGPCQGRLCGLTVTELIAAERNATPAETGYYRLRFPIKPITLGELASLPQTDASIDAVIRIKR